MQLKIKHVRNGSSTFIYNTIFRCLKILKGEFQKDLSKEYGIKALKYLSVDM